jgi:hypothetical protein
MSDPPVAVSDDEILHRIVRPENISGEKPHYMAFYSATEPYRISVDRGEYRTSAESLASATAGARLAALRAGAARELALLPTLRVESVPEHGNPAHAEIIASTEISKKQMKTKVCAMLADISRMV